MMYLAFIDPNLVRLFGYSSRNQSDKNMYVKILQMRMDAKHKKLPQEFLDRLNISNDDIKDGLKLIINSYTGTLRASFNNLCDELQGVSICFTGQCLLLQLGHDLMKIPTVHLSRFNTDAVEVSVEEEYAEEVYKVVHEWEEKTGLEMEDDKIVKLVARDINNYCGIYKVKDGYEVHYKGGVLSRGNHKFIWNNKTHKFKYIFKNDLKSNSLTIVSEALLKYLLFDIPIEETINNCNDIWRYQQISHLGSTYEKCIQESPNGDILLQRNNRIYAGLKPSGTIIKVKPNGRRDSLANCPPNPVVDNDNHLTINDINKNWYIQLAQQWANDFKGIKRLTEYKKIELIKIAEDIGIKFDPKIKKDELIKLIENGKNENNMLQKELKEENKKEVNTMANSKKNIYEKLTMFKKEFMGLDFVMDMVMPGNLGGKEYPSIGQYYKAVQELSEKHSLFFVWEVLNVEGPEKELFKPAGKMPQHVWTVECKATFYDKDAYNYTEDGRNNTPCVTYRVWANGSDTLDKGVSAASSLAFRNFIDKNFTPKYLTIDEFNGTDGEIGTTEEKTTEPTVPTYIPADKKEELTKEVVKETQPEDSESDEVKAIIDNIMKVREITGNAEWGGPTLAKLMNGEIDSVGLMEIELKVNNKLETLGA